MSFAIGAGLNLLGGLFGGGARKKAEKRASISRLLTATSYGRESHPFKDVKLSVSIITYKGILIPRVAFLSDLKVLSFPHTARSL